MIIYKEPNDVNLFKKQYYDGYTTLCNCYGSCSVAESYCYGNNNEWFFQTGCGSYHGVKTNGTSPDKYIFVSTRQYGYQTGCWKLRCPIFQKSNIFIKKFQHSYNANCNACHCNYITDGTNIYCTFSFYGTTSGIIDRYFTIHYIYDKINCCLDIYCKCTLDNTISNTSVDLTGWNIKNITINYYNHLTTSHGVSEMSFKIYESANIYGFDANEYKHFITHT